MTVVTMTFSSSDLNNNNDVIALEGWKTSGPFDILPLHGIKEKNGNA